MKVALSSETFHVIKPPYSIWEVYVMIRGFTESGALIWPVIMRPWLVVAAALPNDSTRSTGTEVSEQGPA